MQLKKNLSLFFVVGALASCSTLYNNTVGLFGSGEDEDSKASATSQSLAEESAAGSAAASSGGSAVQVEKLEKTDQNRTDVEVLWAVPAEAVDQYIVHYGYASDKLDFEIRLDAGSIEKVSDPKHGEVFRYVLDNIPRDKNVFVSLVSVRGTVSSAPSEVLELKGER